MIVSIGSSLPSFKTVQFHAGLNILLSTKSSNSDGRSTRNSAGKSSLVEIVHFLMGAKADAGSLLRHKSLVDHIFFGVFRFGDMDIRVERSGAKPSQIVLDAQLIEDLRLAGKTDKKSGNTYVSNEAWKQFLGYRFFGLPEELRGSAFEPTFTPSFRSMFSYFVRRDGSGGYVHPEKQAEAQSRWDWQENLSYLLDLDWRVPHQLQLVRQREGQLDELKKAAKGGALGAVIGTVAELRPQLVQAQDRATRLRDDTARFSVHDAYSSMMDEATSAKAEMQAILRREVPLRETVKHIEEALELERTPDTADVARVYQSVGIELPGAVRRRFEDVEKFHHSVVENRRLRLREEMERAQRQVGDGQKRVAQLDEMRGAILQSLKGQGALEDFIALQKRLAAAEAEAAALAERYKAAEALESENTQLTIDRASIKRRLQDDHQVRHDRLDHAIRLIGGFIHELYGDRRGNFEVEATENGPEFRISIEGDRGGGIASMEIFCLDLALFVIWSSKGEGPGFLMHDSHLFDGVDARQIAIAIKTAGEVARDWGVQYIVALNSDIFDALPWAEGFDPTDAIITPRLSDADETGGLFGFRFD